MTDEAHLQAAIAEARAAEQSGEVPVGAVIVHNGEILATGQNRVIRDADPTAHAEIVALRAAGRALNNYRLEHCTLYTTLEPCAMCAGAILHARIERLVYAASDPKAGACGSALSVMNHPLLNHRVQVEPGLLAEECGAMLTAFFRSRRKAANAQPAMGIQPHESTAEASPVTTKKAAKKTPKKWSAKINTDSTHPDHGLFLEDAESIAKALATKEVSPKGPASGMRMLNFYINRAGKNLPADRHRELEKAKEILSGIIANQKPSAPSATKRATRKTAVS
ncbi:tRNA adenosine(34) deaminase TadA [Granulicella sibirica]|uniref:tRNA-specific adenosine deaminase n=1 Tax=Granulicella sibirica TaxID=2479048 RepID=A0A4Q0T0V2_9BACT|nr:tRNA adenosine(34) deaminase TadA [Granulicella sibirica]RXH56372.1 tRNA-specific adenosine-34 deaminase [Granulicella sibirica]